MYGYYRRLGRNVMISQHHDKKTTSEQVVEFLFLQDK